MKHRYIFCGVVHGTDKISDFRLISSCTKYSGGMAVRVNIPDDLVLEHYPCDGYSTTEDGRTLDELGWDCIIMYEGHWRKFNDLKEFQPHEWSTVLEYMYGLFDCFDTIGWTPDQAKYAKWFKTPRTWKGPDELSYPFYKERKELILDYNLKEYPFESANEHDTWYRKYQELKENQK